MRGFINITLHHIQLLLYSFNLNGKVKEDEMGRAYGTLGEKMNACRILVEKPEGKV
jgi:hypothetical protein